ncbi:hypothetical protein EV126DRAFT_431199 [Verticillium dahliae]|nr:hypothetical protein EV126DRAFT_431199 [Verticillium dahliae]
MEMSLLTSSAGQPRCHQPFCSASRSCRSSWPLLVLILSILTDESLAWVYTWTRLTSTALVGDSDSAHGCRIMIAAEYETIVLSQVIMPRDSIFSPSLCLKRDAPTYHKQSS